MGMPFPSLDPPTPIKEENCIIAYSFNVFFFLNNKKNKIKMYVKRLIISN